MKKFYFLFVFICILMTSSSHGYVSSLTTQLKSLYWPSTNSQINIYFNPLNSNGISEGTVNNILSDAENQWNNVSGSRINLNFIKTVSSDELNRNEVYFSDDPTLFGSGVIGIALVSYKDSTGEILEADVLINDNTFLSTNKDSSLYLGNVLTHELGHFLGLAHEGVMESTMYYQAERGQHVLADIDKQSIVQLYNNDETTGAIQGKIVGGKDLLGLFGVQVLAFKSSGRLAAAQISDPNGSFHFKGLDPNEVYYIYTQPLLFKSSLPSIYTEVKTNFCTGGEHFRGSFYQTCHKSDEGFPKSLKVKSNTINSVGNVSVRCGFDVPLDYFAVKDSGDPYNLPFLRNSMSTAFTGYFSNKDVVDSKEDVIEFTIPSDAVSSGELNSFTLRINFRSQIFYSIYKADVYVYKNGSLVYGRTPTTSDLVVESDYTLNLDKDITLPVVMGDEIQIKVKAKDWFQYLNFEENASPIKPIGRRSYTSKDFFPGFLLSSFNYNDLTTTEKSYYKNSMAIKDPLNIYFIAIETQHDESGKRIGDREFFGTDNSQCPDAANAYLVKNPLAVSQTPLPKSKNGKIDSDLSFTCGSIAFVDRGNGPGGGMGQFILGFAAIILFSRLRKKYKSKI